MKDTLLVLAGVAFGLAIACFRPQPAIELTVGVAEQEPPSLDLSPLFDGVQRTGIC